MRRSTYFSFMGKRLFGVDGDDSGFIATWECHQLDIELPCD